MYRILFQIQKLYLISKRHIGLFFRRFRKFRILVMDADSYRRIKTDPRFIAAVQLSRIVNSIRSCQRSYFRAGRGSRFADEKDKVDITFLQCSLLYEAILEFKRLSGTLKDLVFWKSNTDKIKTLQHQHSDKKSFWNTVLKPIRNEILFHFEKDSVQSALDRISPSEELFFAVGATSRNRDVVFTLADDAALTYVLADSGPKGKAPVKFDWLHQNLNDLTETFCDVCMGLTIELLRGHVRLEKKRIFLK